jgi:hypothetical protein
MSWALVADVEGCSKFNLGGNNTTHSALTALLSTTTEPHGALSRTIHRWHKQNTGIGAAPHDSQHF